MTVVLTAIMGHGIAAELAGIDLGDTRLDKRSVKMIEAMNANTQASINGSFHTWAETQAAYRFLDNPNVTPEKILAPHIGATKKRIAQQPVVLVLQDTTELDYTKHPPRDAKRLDHEYRPGLYDHTHLAITPEGLQLGVVGQYRRSGRTGHPSGSLWREARCRKFGPMLGDTADAWTFGKRINDTAADSDAGTTLAGFCFGSLCRGGCVINAVIKVSRNRMR